MVKGLYEAVVEALKDATRDYEGEIEENGRETTFSSVNTLDTWSNEWDEDANSIEFVHKYRKIPCTISIREYEEFVSVDLEEATCEYIGGMASPCDCVEEAKERILYGLKRYNYRKKKGFEQLSLF